MRLFEFSAPPRTATTWVQNACTACYLPSGGKASIHIPPNGKHNKLWVTTVRHPADWLLSYWVNIFPGKVSVIEVDAFADLPGTSFDEFILAYLEQMPGGVGKMYEAYRADSYLKIEDLPFCWMEFMVTLRVPEVYRDRCLQIPIMNESDRKKGKPKWNPSLWKAVLNAEEPIMEHFNYV